MHVYQCQDRHDIVSCTLLEPQQPVSSTTSSSIGVFVREALSWFCLENTSSDGCAVVMPCSSAAAALSSRISKFWMYEVAALLFLSRHEQLDESNAHHLDTKLHLFALSAVLA